MSKENPSGEYYVVSYLILRQFIGILGICMPWVLIIGCYITCAEKYLQPSISHYYYSQMHIVMVGIMCLIGSFLIAYKGRSQFENKISNLAGVFALGVAAFPTNCEGFLGDIYILLSKYPCWFEYIHYSSACLLFVCFSIFCIDIFQQSDEGVKTEFFDQKKKIRNMIYKTCGIVIIISIVCIGIIAAFHLKSKIHMLTIEFSTFIFETAAVTAFGISWLVKGSLEWPKSQFNVIRSAARFIR